MTLSKTDIDIDHLEQLAKAATPGSWKAGDLSHIVGGGSVVSNGDGLVVAEGLYSYDAAFIAACDPATMIELMRRLREMAAARDAACDACIELADFECNDSDSVVRSIREQVAALRAVS